MTKAGTRTTVSRSRPHLTKLSIAELWSAFARLDEVLMRTNTVPYHSGWFASLAAQELNPYSAGIISVTFTS